MHQTEQVFLTSRMFEYLSDTQSFVFAHVCYFACQLKFKYTYKSVTKVICNKTGYSPNAVRRALTNLIEMGFLKRVGDDTVEEQRDTSHLKYTYIEQVSHKLQIGEHPEAKAIAKAMNTMIHNARNGQSIDETKKSEEREILFFPVDVRHLKRGVGNQSKRLHKMMLLHGYLSKQHYWNLKHGRGKVTRSVAFLSQLFQWSRTTVQRVIKTLEQLNHIEYSLETNGFVTFKRVQIVKSIRKYTEFATTSLRSIVKQVITPVVAQTKNISSSNVMQGSAQDAVAALKAYQQTNR